MVLTLNSNFKINHDNVIFSLQKAGGISVYWFELLRRFTPAHNVANYELPNSNIFGSQLLGETELESRIPLPILRYFPFTHRLERCSIFHSSYYRVSLQRDIANITTVHDFTYEYFSSGFTKKFIRCKRTSRLDIRLALFVFLRT